MYTNGKHLMIREGIHTHTHIQKHTHTIVSHTCLVLSVSLSLSLSLCLSRSYTLIEISFDPRRCTHTHTHTHTHTFTRICILAQAAMHSTSSLQACLQNIHLCPSDTNFFQFASHLCFPNTFFPISLQKIHRFICQTLTNTQTNFLQRNWIMYLRKQKRIAKINGICI